jgi:hypothetical protein
MSNDYDPVPRNPLGLSLLAMIVGIIGTVIAFRIQSLLIAAIILGAVGMIIGGYAVSLGNHTHTPDRLQYMLMAGVGIMTSVIAFIVGLVYWLE